MNKLCTVRSLLLVLFLLFVTYTTGKPRAYKHRNTLLFASHAKVETRSRSSEHKVGWKYDLTGSSNIGSHAVSQGTLAYRNVPKTRTQADKYGTALFFRHQNYGYEKSLNTNQNNNNATSITAATSSKRSRSNNKKYNKNYGVNDNSFNNIVDDNNNNCTDKRCLNKDNNTTIQAEHSESINIHVDVGQVFKAESAPDALSPNNTTIDTTISATTDVTTNATIDTTTKTTTGTSRVIRQPSYTHSPATESIVRTPVVSDTSCAPEKMFPSYKYPLPRNRYKCGIFCTCYDREDGGTVAKCKRIHLFIIPWGPPPTLELLDISDTGLDYFQNPENITMYPRLKALNVSKNAMYKASSLSPKKHLPLENYDLSLNRITVLEDDAFSCMPRLKELYLQHNQIQNITNNTFRNNPRLEQLDLSYNDLTNIQLGAFDTLKNLKTLSLNNNKRLGYKKHFIVRLLQPLSKLEQFYIQGLGQGSDAYPDDALGVLPSLRELRIDGAVSAELGPPLRSLRNLHSIEFGVADGACHIENVTASFLSNVPHLRTLKFEECVFKDFSPQVFDSVPSLQEFSFYRVSYYKLGEILSKLPPHGNSSLKKLALNFMTVYTELQHCPANFLVGNDLGNLPYLSQLEELYLEHNSLLAIFPSFLEGLPKSLKKISVSRNLLKREFSLAHKLTFLKCLQTLDESFQMYTDPTFSSTNGLLPKLSLTPLVSEPNAAKFACTKEQELGQTFRQRSYKPITRHRVTDVNSTTTYKGGPLPPNLITYNASHSLHLGMPMGKTHTDMKVLNMSNVYYRHWGANKLYSSIEVVDVSNNYCDYLHIGFFPPVNALREFYAQNNLLGNVLGSDKRGDLLARCTNVTLMNLANNFIQELPLRAFRGLINIKVLDLSNNKLRVFHVDVSHMSKLEQLDLTMNSVAWIHPDSRFSFDSVSLRHVIFVTLLSNPLPCTCTALDFLKWLSTTTVTITDRDFLGCVQEGSEKKIEIGDLAFRVQTLQKECTTYTYMIVATASGSAICLVVIKAALLFKYRWKLKYWRNILLAKYFGNHKQRRRRQGAVDGGDGDENDEELFKYDAYIIYSQEDRNFALYDCLRELETKRGHVICVEDRDFALGAYMPGDITNAVQKSVRTVPLITPDFIEEGEWCEYGLQMAVMETIFQKRTVLHPIILQPTPAEIMSRDLLKVMNQNDFSEFPPEEGGEEVREAFWDALSRVIGHVRPPGE